MELRRALARCGAAALVLGAALVPALGRALDGEPEDVRQALSREVSVNWTTLSVEVTSSARGRGVGATHKALEHQARESIGPDVAWAALRVPVTSDLTVADLLEEPDLHDALSARTERWVVTEARYYTSGRVELLGELPLQELLKPWALRQAPLAPADERPTAFTGLVVDARGTGATPAFAPRLVADGGEVLWSGRLWDDVALFQAPVVYVPDPAHPAAARAGAHPLVLQAVAAQGADLVVGEDDRVRFRTGLGGTRVPGEGTVVIVVDP